MSDASWDEDEQLKPHHLAEWVEGSGVDPEIASRNIVSLDGEAAITTLCGDRLDGMRGHANQYATAPVAKLLKRYEHAADGGWFCAPLITNNGWVTKSAWGCFKPDHPVNNAEGKLIKYEHPLDAQCGVFWLRNKSDNYWAEILSNPATSIIVITEGAKKAAALLSTGMPAVALSGIWNGTPKVDPSDPQSLRQLHPDLLPLAKHRVVIAFDYSDNGKGREAVRRAMQRLADYLYAAGCPWVGDATCKGPIHKGVDDILVNDGAEALQDQVRTAVHISKDPKARISDWQQLVAKVDGIADPVQRTQTAWRVIRGRAQEVVLDGAKVIEQQAIIKSLGKEFGLALDKRDIDSVLTDVVREATTKVEPVMGGGRLTINPKRWVLKDLILNGFNLLNGMPGAGKSRLLMALVLAWVRGHDSFLGHKLYAPPNSRVLILGLDQDLQEWVDVLAPLQLMSELSCTGESKEYSLDRAIDLYPLGSGVNLDRDGLQLMSRWTADNPDGLIIGDSVSALLPAGVSESDDSLGRWARDIDESRRGAPLILTHHITKEAAFSGNTGVYAGRGSGSLDAAASRVLGLSYQFHKQDGKDVLHTDSPRRQLVSQKRGAENQSLIVEMGPSGCWDYIGTASELREMNRQDEEDSPASAKLKGWNKEVWASTTAEWLTTSEVFNRISAEKAKASNAKQQVRRTLRDLATDEGLLESKDDAGFQGEMSWRRKYAST